MMPPAPALAARVTGLALLPVPGAPEAAGSDSPPAPVADAAGREPVAPRSSAFLSFTQSFDRQAKPALQVAFAQQEHPSSPVVHVSLGVQLDAIHTQDRTNAQKWHFHRIILGRVASTGR